MERGERAGVHGLHRLRHSEVEDSVAAPLFRLPLKRTSAFPQRSNRLPDVFGPRQQSRHFIAAELSDSFIVS